MNTHTPTREMTGESSKAAGFTLLELLITMSLAAILLTIAVPSFRYVTNSNRIAAEVNGLLGDLQFARAEAIKEGRNVTVCVADALGNCTNAASWENGWIVFSDLNNNGMHDTGENIWRQQTAFSSTDTFTLMAPNSAKVVTFNREGYAVGIANGTLLELHTSPTNQSWTRCLSINLSGSMTTQLYGDVNNGATCQ